MNPDILAPHIRASTLLLLVLTIITCIAAPLGFVAWGSFPENVAIAGNAAMRAALGFSISLIVMSLALIADRIFKPKITTTSGISRIMVMLFAMAGAVVISIGAIHVFGRMILLTEEPVQAMIALGLVLMSATLLWLGVKEQARQAFPS